MGRILFRSALAEQQRIVAKVDQLMRLCDELEAGLAQTETVRRSVTAATLQADRHDLAHPSTRQDTMTDRELLQQMIDRIGKEPRAVKFDDDDNLIELNLAGLDLEEFPEEVYSHFGIFARHWQVWAERILHAVKRSGDSW